MKQIRSVQESGQKMARKFAQNGLIPATLPGLPPLILVTDGGGCGSWVARTRQQASPHPPLKPALQPCGLACPLQLCDYLTMQERGAEGPGAAARARCTRLAPAATSQAWPARCSFVTTSLCENGGPRGRVPLQELAGPAWRQWQPQEPEWPIACSSKTLITSLSKCVSVEVWVWCGQNDVAPYARRCATHSPRARLLGIRRLSNTLLGRRVRLARVRLLLPLPLGSSRCL